MNIFILVVFSRSHFSYVCEKVTINQMIYEYGKKSNCSITWEVMATFFCKVNFNILVFFIYLFILVLFLQFKIKEMTLEYVP